MKKITVQRDRAVTEALRRPRFALEFLRFRLAYDPLKSWFYFALLQQMEKAIDGWAPFGNYYEFGVGEGGSLIKYIQALRAFCRHFHLKLDDFHIFAFDTFAGLPEPVTAKDKHPEWAVGKFACNLTDIKEKVRKQGISPECIRLVEGLFEKTLMPALGEELRASPPSIVNIDVDYYTSCKLVLDWLKPFLMSGTLFYFDDVWEFHGNPDYGELAAIKEFNESGEGQLVLYPRWQPSTLIGQAYIYTRKEFEYTKEQKG